jgi:hypothetical protein
MDYWNWLLVKKTAMKKRIFETVLVVLILCLALGLRLWGLAYDLPNVFHADEPWPLNIAYGMLTTGDMNPHFFDWGSLVIYINFIIQAIARWLTGGASSAVTPVIFRGMGIAFTEVPGLVLASRLVSVAFGVATVGLVMAAGKKTGERIGTGLLAGLLMALVFTGVTLSKVITADVYATFFVTLVLLASLAILKSGKTSAYIWAGIGLGLAVASKYNTALVVLTILMAHFLRNSLKGFKDYRLYLCAVVAALAFFIGMPYAILSFKEFYTGFASTGQHYASGHAGMEGNTLSFYLGYMWQTGGILYTLAFLEVLRGIITRNKALITVAVFPVVYFIFISSFFVRNDRTLLPFTPFAFVLAASFLVFLWQKVKDGDTRRKQVIGQVVVIVLILTALLLPSIYTARTSAMWASATSREDARVWIEENLPSASKIAYESYAPYIDTQHYEVTSLAMMIDQQAEWYRENGIEYMAFGSGMYARFYNDPQRYPDQVQKYDALFAEFELVKQFKDEIFEVKIYKVE